MGSGGVRVVIDLCPKRVGVSSAFSRKSKPSFVGLGDLASPANSPSAAAAALTTRSHHRRTYEMHATADPCRVPASHTPKALG